MNDTLSKILRRLLPLAVAALFCSGLFSRCANIGLGGPQGGPKDTLPANVVRMSPRFNAVNLRPERIEIEFDEYIVLEDQMTQFYTSPFLEKKPTLSVKNRSVFIDVDTPLDSAQTYVFNLGSAVVDNNEGNPLHNLKYTFSTGDHIDSLYMSGFVSNGMTGDTTKGSYILFYDAALDTLPTGPDSLLFSPRKASAVAKTLSHGGFVFANLKPIDYKVYAWLDGNGNNLYDPGQDEAAFLDSTVNPAEMPAFLMWYDSTRMHVVAEPQTFFNSFVEEPVRRQNLSSYTRPAAQQIILKFAAANPVVEAFDLRGIDSARIRVEQPLSTRDSILYWLDVPAEELPDTIVGQIAYQRHDSVGQLYRHEQELRFVWKKPFVAPPAAPDTLAADASPKEIRRWERRNRKRIEAEAEAEVREAFVADSLAGVRADSIRIAALPDSLRQAALDSLAMPPVDTIPPSKMKFSFTGDGPVIPGMPPRMVFELPVIGMDTAAFRLTTPGADSTVVDVPFTMEADSLRIREYLIRAEWLDGKSYSLSIPDSTIRTLDGEWNDSLRHAIQAAAREEMGTVDLAISGNPDSTAYIVQIMDAARTNVLREKIGVTGTDTIHYIAPGKIVLRLIQDRNGNGRWDTGSVVERRQPEAVRWYPAVDTASVELTEPKLEFEVEIDLGDIFRPWAFTGSEALEEEIAAEGETVATENESAISEKVSSRAHVEEYELTDPKTRRREEKAARKSARRARRAQGARLGTDEELIPGNELNYLKDDVTPH